MKHLHRIQVISQLTTLKYTHHNKNKLNGTGKADVRGVRLIFNNCPTLGFPLHGWFSE